MTESALSALEVNYSYDRTLELLSSVRWQHGNNERIYKTYTKHIDKYTIMTIKTVIYSMLRKKDIKEHKNSVASYRSGSDLNPYDSKALKIICY